MKTAGERTFDLSGIVLTVRDLPADLSDALARRWSAFASEVANAHLAVVLRDGLVPGSTIQRPAAEADDDSEPARFESSGGTIVVDPDGRCELVLARAPTADRLHALTNLLLAALAHIAPRRSTLVVHGAGIVLGGTGFVLVGPSGSGKSTWLDLASRSAEPISDDLLAIEARGGPAHVLALPFRRYPTPTAGPGRWPLGALLLPVHGETARLEPVDRRVARAALVGNLPHVAPARRLGVTVSGVVDRVIDGVPLRRLVFARDPGFVDLLRPLASGG